MKHCSQKSPNRLTVLLFALTTGLLPYSSHARCEIDISDYVGWQVIYSGTVTGYVDEHGEEQDHFEGCEYDRLLIVDYSRTVVCAGYAYAYAYHPDIVIISNGVSLEACINNEMYDIRRW